MSIVVNTNTASLNAINNLSQTTNKLSGSFARISSGLRITSAADDAAGLGVAENLESAQRAATVAGRNAGDGISLLQVAEGAASEVSDILMRMNELAIESASETLEATERQYIQDEFLELSAEIDRIAVSTSFNGVALADGTFPTISVHVGIGNDALADKIAITTGDLTAATIGVDALSMDLSTVAGADTAIGDLQTALDTINGYRSGYGASQNRLESAVSSLAIFGENTAAAESRIRDADFATETAEMAKLQIMQQAGIAVLSQANVVSQGALSLLG
jgi:flagellin